MRTFERGVEGETLSCGTGGMAAALVAWRMFSMEEEIEVEFASGEVLHYVRNEDGVEMRGDVRRLFCGEWEQKAHKPLEELCEPVL